MGCFKVVVLYVLARTLQGLSETVLVNAIAFVVMKYYEIITQFCFHAKAFVCK